MWPWRKRQPVAEERICFHSWRLADVAVVWTDNGVESDYHNLWTLGCEHCNRIRRVDSLEYETLRENGMIKE